MEKNHFIYCYVLNTEFYGNKYYTSHEEEFNYAKERTDTVFYDLKKDIFLNADNSIANIKGKSIFLRNAGVENLETVVNAIIRKGGIPINSIEDINRIKNWMKEIDVNRKIMIVKGKDILEDEIIRKKIKILAGNSDYFFLKTNEKDFSRLIGIEEIDYAEYGLLEALKYHQEEEFIISEPVEILKDEYGNLEYRCFIVNGKIVSISRELLLTLHNIPIEAYDFANMLLEKVKKKKDFPNTFVLDFMLCIIPGTSVIIPDFVELNPIEASGEYLYNTIYEDSILMKHMKNKNDCELLPKNLYQTRQEMLDYLPIYKTKKNISFSNQEPHKIMKQCYYKDGFSYHYGCAKKFGNPLQDRFYIHNYFQGGYGCSISSEEILNGNISINTIFEHNNIEILRKHFKIDIDEERVKRGIILEEQQMKKQRKLKNNIIR